ncbi:MAG: YgaC family protein [Actinobacteria bacterium]|nr:YgaC family protein [Actinomycetota bacterium]
MPEPVTVQYFKHPRTPHWRQQMRLLGDDEHGIWLGMDEGAFFRKGADAPVPSPTPMVQLVRPGAWWTLLYNGPRHRYPVYVDVIAPATWFGGRRVEMVDLDLDVVQLTDGSVRLLDEDEFADHRVSLGYPQDWIAGAERAAREVTEMLTGGLEPFAARMRAWHDHLTGGAPTPA